MWKCLGEERVQPPFHNKPLIGKEVNAILNIVQLISNVPSVKFKKEEKKKKEHVLKYDLAYRFKQRHSTFQHVMLVGTGLGTSPTPYCAHL